MFALIQCALGLGARKFYQLSLFLRSEYFQPYPLALSIMALVLLRLLGHS